MKIHQRLSRSFAPLIAAVLSSPLLLSVAHAQEHEAHEVPSISTLLLPVINFSIFLFVFFRYAWPVMRAALVDRRKLVAEELAAADRAHQEAKAARAAVEELRSRLATDGQKLLEEMRAEGEREKAALIQAANAGAERIRKDATLLVEQETARSLQTIRKEIADEVVARVTATLRERLTAADDERFVARFVGALDAEAGR